MTTVAVAITAATSSTMIAAKDANILGQIQPAKSKMIEEVDMGTHSTSDRVAIEVCRTKHAPQETLPKLQTPTASTATLIFENESKSNYDIDKPPA